MSWSKLEYIQFMSWWPNGKQISALLHSNHAYNPVHSHIKCFTKNQSSAKPCEGHISSKHNSALSQSSVGLKSDQQHSLASHQFVCCSTVLYPSGYGCHPCAQNWSPHPATVKQKNNSPLILHVTFHLHSQPCIQFCHMPNQLKWALRMMRANTWFGSDIV